jgi:ribosome-associated heat shock protein Hsp15
VDAKGRAIRVDKWLYHARFCKTRSLAARVVAEGRIRVNSVRITRPSTPLHVGDGISFALGGQVRALKVTGLGVRRGPASEARRLYQELIPAGGGAPPPLDPADGLDT